MRFFAVAQNDRGGGTGPPSIPPWTGGRCVGWTGGSERSGLIEVTREWLEARREMPAREIAAELGCGDAWVYRLFQKHGVQRACRGQEKRPGKYDWVTREWLEARAHLTNGQLAAEIGCTYKYVSELRKRHGLLRRRRKRSEAEVYRSCPCGPCAAECMARALADEAVWCEVG